ncbi:unnamed protein product [Mytilus coruscus]|uniref:Uncharacterized protein n=1 Tax=Mytilus coruscus TaxID=42192 RepID=A0A6J8DXW2_MYTCO|nr:unnamed protein product [Mytilus coruscus]
MSYIHSIVAQVSFPIISAWSAWGEPDTNGVKRRSRTVMGVCGKSILGSNFPLVQRKTDLKLDNAVDTGDPSYNDTEQDSDIIEHDKFILSNDAGDEASPTISTKTSHGNFLRRINTKIASVHILPNQNVEISDANSKDITPFNTPNRKKIHEKLKTLYRKYFIQQANPLSHYYKIPSYRMYNKTVPKILKVKYLKSAILNGDLDVISTTPEPTTEKTYWNDAGLLGYKDEYNKWYRDQMIKANRDQGSYRDSLGMPDDRYGRNMFSNRNYNKNQPSTVHGQSKPVVDASGNLATNTTGIYGRNQLIALAESHNRIFSVDGSYAYRPISSDSGSYGSRVASSSGFHGRKSQSSVGSYESHPQNSAGSYGSHPQNSAGSYRSHPQSSAGSYGSHTQSSAGSYGSQSQSSAESYGSQPQSSAGSYGSQPQSSAGSYGSQPQSSAGSYGSQPQSSAGSYAGSYGSQPQGSVGTYDGSYRSPLDITHGRQSSGNGGLSGKRHLSNGGSYSGQHPSSDGSHVGAIPTSGGGYRPPSQSNIPSSNDYISNHINQFNKTEHYNFDQMNRAEYLKSKSDFGDIFSILAMSGGNSNLPSSGNDYSTIPTETGDAYSIGWDNPSSGSRGQQNISPNEAEGDSYTGSLHSDSGVPFESKVSDTSGSYIDQPSLHSNQHPSGPSDAKPVTSSDSHHQSSALRKSLKKTTASDEPYAASTGTFEKHHSTSDTSYEKSIRNFASHAVQQVNNGEPKESSVNHGPEHDDNKPNQTINGDTLHTFKDPFDGSSIDANDHILSNTDFSDIFSILENNEHLNVKDFENIPFSNHGSHFDLDNPVTA